MPNESAYRFRFIGHALAGDGPFRPAVSGDADGNASFSGPSYLVRYPREGNEKFARRNEVAFFASPLARACSRFVGYMSTKPPVRTFPHALYEGMAEDIDGRGNSLEIFFQKFIANAKARGSMLLLVDMGDITRDAVPNQAAQIAVRASPFWNVILPEKITAYELGDDGKFNFAEFDGNVTMPDGKREQCVWHFDRTEWWAAAKKSKATLKSGTHALGECPLLIWTEGGEEFPYFGPFAAIADLARRLFNAESELDEIIRSVTFPVLAMEVSEDSTPSQKLAAAQSAGETLGMSNMMVHSGTLAYVAPPNGPAEMCMKRIEMLKAQIDELSLNVATINEQESGIAMKMRFQAVNAELSRCAASTEDLERRAWELSAKWLNMQAAPEVEWSRDYDIADVELELKILADMQASAMPPQVIKAQQERIVKIQFGNLDAEHVDELIQALDEQQQGIGIARDDSGNVIQLPDRNAPVREAAMRALNG